MNQLNELIQQAKLSEAIDFLAGELQQKPQDLDLRSSFIELLCIDGQLERADKQLNVIIKQHPQCLAGATNIRQLVRAAQSRIDFSQGAATASLVKEADEAFASLLKMRLARKENDMSLLVESAEKLEEARQDSVVTVGGQQRERLRDLDDSLAGFLELFGTNGEYYLVPVDAVIRMEMQPVSSLIELVWRRVNIEIEGGLAGEAFVPMTYLDSENEAQKLGRETDWEAVGGTELCVGLGLKMFLFGEEALTMSQMTSLEKHATTMV